MSIQLIHIGKSADDLRFFILMDGAHAGGITVHSVRGAVFSYGIAISPHKRRRGAAKSALPLLFDCMREKGFERAVVQVEPGNAASLALHAALGFEEVSRCETAVTLSRGL